MVIFCSRRASARSFSMCLNSSCVVEPMTRSWPVVRIGLISVARSIVPPVVAPAPTVEWISSMKRIGFGRFASAAITALKRSSKSPRKRVPASSAPVSSEKTSAPCEHVRHVVAAAAARPALRRARSCRRPASPTKTGLFLRRRHRISIVRCSSSARPISGSSSPARARAGEVRRVGARADRATCRRRARRRRLRLRRRRRRPAALPGVRRRHLADAVRDVLEHVEPGDALRRQQLRRVRLGLLQHRREHVARLHFLAPGALHVQHRGLQHAAERQRLLGLLLLAAAELLDRVVEVLVEIAAQLRQIGAAGGQDPLAVRIVRQRVEQVLERQVGVPPRRRLAVRDGQDDFERRAEHLVSGRPPSRPAAESRARARVVMTASTLVSATSHG